VAERKAKDADEVGLVEPTHRLCALTRAELPPDELIRFVADPSGDIVPDLARRLPGRGVWVKAEKALVAEAAKANIFARSLKRPVKVAGDLAERVEALLLRRALEAFALTNKAGLLTTGFAQVASLIEGGGVAALVHGHDAAPGGREKLDRKFTAIAREKGRKNPIVTSLSTEQLSLAIGRSNVVHAALIPGGATQRFLSEAERFERYRSGSCSSPFATGAESLRDLDGKDA
jgi:predicted RNA-binding protein YlxR (DUF448 family)